MIQFNIHYSTIQYAMQYIIIQCNYTSLQKWYVLLITVPAIISKSTNHSKFSRNIPLIRLCIYKEKVLWISSYTRAALNKYQCVYCECEIFCAVRLSWLLYVTHECLENSNLTNLGGFMYRDIYFDML